MLCSKHGASINAILFKFYSSIQQKVKLLPTHRKVISADGNSFGPISEVHLKFKVGKIDFNDVFVILNNLQWDIILGLPWQCNYRIGYMWNREGKPFPYHSKQIPSFKYYPTIARTISKIKRSMYIAR